MILFSILPYSNDILQLSCNTGMISRWHFLTTCSPIGNKSALDIDICLSIWLCNSTFCLQKRQARGTATDSYVPSGGHVRETISGANGMSLPLFRNPIKYVAQLGGWGGRTLLAWLWECNDFPAFVYDFLIVFGNWSLEVNFRVTSSVHAFPHTRRRSSSELGPQTKTHGTSDESSVFAPGTD